MLSRGSATSASEYDAASMILKTSVSLKRRPSYGPLFFPAAFSKLATRPVSSFSLRMCGMVTVRLISSFGAQNPSSIVTAVIGTARIG